MSNEVLIAVAIGVLILAVAFIAILLWDGSTPKAEPIDNNDELQVWTDRANKAKEDFGLADTRSAGEKWAASIAAILGVLSAVAFISGPSSLVKDVGGTPAKVAGGLFLVAGGVAAIATLLAALAEHGTPVSVKNLTGPLYRTLLRTRARRAVTQIRWSRILTVIALLLMVTATSVAWATALTETKDSSQSAIVVSTAGGECGTLSQTNGSLSLKVGSATKPIAPDSVVTLVDACPEQ